MKKRLQFVRHPPKFSQKKHFPFVNLPLATTGAQYSDLEIKAHFQHARAHINKASAEPGRNAGKLL